MLGGGSTFIKFNIDCLILLLLPARKGKELSHLNRSIFWIFLRTGYYRCSDCFMSDFPQLLPNILSDLAHRLRVVTVPVSRVPAGVDEAAYVKAGFLAAVAKGTAKSPLITPTRSVAIRSRLAHSRYPA